MSLLAGFRGAFRRARRGSSMAEIMVAGGILVAGVVPLFTHWVKLAHDTGGVTSKARAFRGVQESVDRYQALGAARLIEIAAPDGSLGQVAGSADSLTGTLTPPSGRFGAALRLAARGVASSAGVVGTGTIAKSRVNAAVVRDGALLRLTVASDEFPELKIQRLMPVPIEPAAPAWQ